MDTNQPVRRDDGKVPVERARFEFRGEFSAGPLPPPAVLKQYDDIVPGAADRILTMAESQSRHRRDLETKVINADTRNARLGLIFGFLIGMTGVVGGIVVILGGQGQILGGFISVGALAALVGVFVYGSTQRRKEREIRRIDAAGRR